MVGPPSCFPIQRTHYFDKASLKVLVFDISSDSSLWKGPRKPHGIAGTDLHSALLECYPSKAWSNHPVKRNRRQMGFLFTKMRDDSKCWEHLISDAYFDPSLQLWYEYLSYSFLQGLRDKICKLGRGWCVVWPWKNNWKQLFLLLQWRYTTRQDVPVRLVYIP